MNQDVGYCTHPGIVYIRGPIKGYTYMYICIYVYVYNDITVKIL